MRCARDDARLFSFRPRSERRSTPQSGCRGTCSASTDRQTLSRNLQCPLRTRNRGGWGGCGARCFKAAVNQTTANPGRPRGTGNESTWTPLTPPPPHSTQARSRRPSGVWLLAAFGRLRCTGAPAIAGDALPFLAFGRLLEVTFTLRAHSARGCRLCDGWERPANAGAWTEVQTQTRRVCLGLPALVLLLGDGGDEILEVVLILNDVVLSNIASELSERHCEGGGCAGEWGAPGRHWRATARMKWHELC